jgi:arylsulfatase A-like enzyme
LACSQSHTTFTPSARAFLRAAKAEAFAANFRHSAALVSSVSPSLARNSASDLPLPRAHTAIIVVLSEINHSLLPPWSELTGLVHLRDIAGEAVAFTRFRLSSSIATSNLATALSGTPPKTHGLERPDQRLSPGGRTLQEMVKEASGRTAMFTSVPTSFAAFGLAEHWDRFESYSPVDDVSASEPFSQALSWLAAHPQSSSPRLVLIHARGGHPPWDLSRQESEALPPADYAGRLQPRRGALILKEIRDRPQRTLRRLSEADWIRLSAMQQATLSDQDAALGKLVDALRADGTWADTLLIVTTDRSLADRPSLPLER